MLIRSILLFFLAFFMSEVNATHNRAGEISFEQIDDLTIRMTITTYTKTSSTSADRDSLEVFWGDDSSEFVKRSNGSGENIDNDVKINYYVAEHTYPGRDTYTIFFMDPNRVDNILNVNPPNSVDVPFYLETTFTFLNSQFQGINNSPILLQAPLDFACVGQPFYHNPNAYDADGDSIAYELIVPLQLENTPVPDYSYPDQIAPGLDNIVSLNQLTGDFEWKSPKIQGEYNIAIRIKEYRNGILISSMIRDMQILVRDCDNRPPTIESIDEICVVAGELLELDILVDDVDMGQQVALQGTGGPFQQSVSPAEILGDSIFQDVAYTAKFVWQTSCEHINDQYYQVVLRAVDDFFGDTGLATLKTIRIKVVGPAPENLSATANDNSLMLMWDFPYQCQNTSNDYFQGFSVWRKLLSNPFEIDTCTEGLAGKGYTKIVFNTSDNDGTSYFYEDLNIESGKTYCYRILAEFALLSPAGNPFNRVESLASEEVCLQLKRDLPLITKVSVNTTDPNSGAIDVRWTKPLATDLDTIVNPGPYTYVLKGGSSLTDLQVISGATFSSAFLGDPIDTFFQVPSLNTEQLQYFFEVDFYTGSSTAFYGSSQFASSVFLDIAPNDNRLNLDWSYSTPWVNHTFIIYRFNDTSSSFDSIDITDIPTYTDLELDNGKEYCYYVRALGSYGLMDIEDPLDNLSQEKCATPIDLQPPCPPELIVQSICDKIENITDADDLINELYWTNPDIVCIDTDDVAYYNIYFSLNGGNDFELLNTVDGSTNLNYNHLVENNVLGCYAVTAIDFNGNESSLSNTICVENCPLYELPNTFTPNLDGFNDLFVPIKNVFINKVDFKVFNRWGNLVFETEDPLLLWDGKNLSNKELADGTYYYSCKVYEQSASGIVEEIDIISGFIHLIRG